MSDVAEKAAEVTAEVVEEGVDGVVETLEVMRNNPVTLAVAGLVGVGVGAAGGYFVARKLLRKYYSDLAEVEIAQAKEFYAGVYKTDPDGAVLTPQEVLTQRHGPEAASEALRTYQGRQAAEAILEKDELEVALDDQDEAQVRKIEEARLHSISLEKEADPSKGVHPIESVGEPSEMRNVFLDPTFDMEEEVKLRTPDKPYIITHDEYFAAEKEYDTISLTYYEDDDTLADEQDKPIREIDKTIGEDHLVRFGSGSKDRNIVYIRNDKLETDYEVIKSTGSYLEALGLGPEPGELKHSDQRDQRRAFRRGEG